MPKSFASVPHELTLPSSFNVTITTAAPLTVQVDASETIHNLILAAPDTLAIHAAKTLTLAGPTLTNSGALLLTGTKSALAFTTNVNPPPASQTSRLPGSWATSTSMAS